MTAHSRTRFALLQRAERAVMRLYHLATPRYPRDFGPYADQFDSWLSESAQWALQDYVADDFGRDFVGMFGDVYSWGRGGRTLAPSGIIRQRGGSSFSLTAESLDDWSAERLTRAVQLLERFGDDVAAWNADVPRQWADYTAATAADETASARATLDEGRTVVVNLLSDLRKIRREGISAPAVCDAMRRVIRAELAKMRDARATVRTLSPALA